MLNKIKRKGEKMKKKYSKNYKKYAEDVKGDIRKNTVLADYYVERSNKDIRSSKRTINSIKKQAGKEDYSSAISQFEERIKDVILLIQQIGEILQSK